MAAPSPSLAPSLTTLLALALAPAPALAEPAPAEPAPAPVAFVAAPEPAPAAVARPEVAGDPGDGDHRRDRHHHRQRRPELLWGGVTLGLAFAPDRPKSDLNPGASRVTVDHMHPWSGPIRGIDLRWQDFTTRRGRYPRTIGYFRSGFYRSAAAFGPAAASYLRGQATEVDVLTVPLFLGGNLYLFRDFPVRPFAGLGFGFDVMRLRYATHGGGAYSDVSARIGFELHAGLEVRITNYIALSAEVMQLWSARRKVADLPDVSNETFSVLLGVTGAFPLPR